MLNEIDRKSHDDLGSMESEVKLLSVYFRVMGVFVQDQSKSKSRRSWKNSRPRIISPENLLANLNQKFLESYIVLFIEAL